MKTYTLTCPDEDCNEEFEIEADPLDLAKGEEATQGPITCQTCLEEWEWSYDEEADALVLVPDEFDFDDENDEEECEFEDEDDEEEEG